jgi:hypothetical protein
VGESYEYESSLCTQDKARQHYGLPGGNGSQSEDEHPNVPDYRPPLTGPPAPPPPGPPPPQLPGPSGRRMLRAKVKPIKLKDPYPFEGKPGDDFDALWIIVQTFIQDQPEKFNYSGSSINWIGGFLTKYAAAWHGKGRLWQENFQCPG